MTVVATAAVAVVVAAAAAAVVSAVMAVVAVAAAVAVVVATVAAVTTVSATMAMSDVLKMREELIPHALAGFILPPILPLWRPVVCILFRQLSDQAVEIVRQSLLFFAAQALKQFVIKRLLLCRAALLGEHDQHHPPVGDIRFAPDIAALLQFNQKLVQRVDANTQQKRQVLRTDAIFEFEYGQDSSLSPGGVKKRLGVSGAAVMTPVQQPMQLLKLPQ
jgi:hypothetical protein